MEEDDVEMLCPRIEEAVLRNLLYPFHLITVESEIWPNMIVMTHNYCKNVSVVNGKPEGAVFEKHTLNDFTSTTIMDGVAINKDAQTNMSDVYINISKSILDNELGQLRKCGKGLYYEKH